MQLNDLSELKKYYYNDNLIEIVDKLKGIQKDILKENNIKKDFFINIFNKKNKYILNEKNTFVIFIISLNYEPILDIMIEKFFYLPSLIDKIKINKSELVKVNIFLTELKKIFEKENQKKMNEKMLFIFNNINYANLYCIMNLCMFNKQIIQMLIDIITGIIIEKRKRNEK